MQYIINSVYKELCGLLQSAHVLLVTAQEKAVSPCNGNLVLRELSINLPLTIGSVRSLKIEDIHSRSLRLGLGLCIHLRAPADRVLQWMNRAWTSKSKWIFNSKRPCLCLSRWYAVTPAVWSRYASGRLTVMEPLSCTGQAVLRNRLTWMETNGHIPSSGGQRFTLCSPLTSQPPSLPQCRQDMASLTCHLISPNQMFVQSNDCWHRAHPAFHGKKTCVL